MIRRANQKDIDDLNRLLLQVLEVHHQGRSDLFKSHSVKYTNQQLIQLLQDDSRPVFVYQQDEKVVGYGFCVIQQVRNHNILTDHKTLYIDDICIDENYRHQGIGKAIFQAIEAYAKEIGCDNLTLNVWAFNQSALAFYQMMDMQPQRIIMEKKL